MFQVSTATKIKQTIKSKTLNYIIDYHQEKKLTYQNNSGDGIAID